MPASAIHTVDIEEAESHLADLVDKAAGGEPFIIARAGKPLVQVTALESREERARRRIGFLDGQIEVPDDFDTMYADEIAELFEGGS